MGFHVSLYWARSKQRQGAATAPAQARAFELLLLKLVVLSREEGDRIPIEPPNNNFRTRIQQVKWDFL